MKKEWIICLAVVFAAAVGVAVYFLIKKKKTSEEQENKKELTDNSENNNCNNSTSRQVDSADEVKREVDNEPFLADSEIVIDENQSRTTEEYVQWQKDISTSDVPETDENTNSNS